MSIIVLSVPHTKPFVLDCSGKNSFFLRVVRCRSLADEYSVDSVNKEEISKFWATFSFSSYCSVLFHDFLCFLIGWLFSITVHLNHVHLISICLCVLSLMHGQSRQRDGFLPHAPCHWSLLSAALPLPRYSKGFPSENSRTYIGCVFTFGMLPLSFLQGINLSHFHLLSSFISFLMCFFVRSV